MAKSESGLILLREDRGNCMDSASLAVRENFEGMCRMVLDFQRLMGQACLRVLRRPGPSIKRILVELRLLLRRHLDRCNSLSGQEAHRPSVVQDEDIDNPMDLIHKCHQ